MKKKLLWFIPALLFLIPIVIPFKSDLVIFPSVKKYKLTPYNDNADSTGNSASAITEYSASSIVFDYTLRRLRGNPYAGFTIDLFGADSFVDISSYDSICVDIVTKQATAFEIQCKTFIENVTEMTDFRTCHTLTYQVTVDIKSKRYSIPLDKLRIPDWWYTETYKRFGPKAANLPREPNYKKLFGINFHSGSGTVENIPDRFTVTKIAFVKEYKRGLIALICLGGFALYCIAVFLIIVLRGKRKSEDEKKGEEAETIVKDPPPIVFPEVEENETDHLIDYINAHYQEPELTLEQVAQGAQILPPLRVTSQLQQKFNMNFRQYLNDLRIRESKRLLAHTDKNISEIAFAVGYNNIPHFNRVFKEVVGIAPTQYRDTNQKDSDKDIQA